MDGPLQENFAINVLNLHFIEILKFLLLDMKLGDYLEKENKGGILLHVNRHYESGSLFTFPLLRDVSFSLFVMFIYCLILSVTTTSCMS